MYSDYKTGELNADGKCHMSIKCWDYRRRHRNRDPNTAINIFRLLPSKLELYVKQAYLKSVPGSSKKEADVEKNTSKAGLDFIGKQPKHENVRRCQSAWIFSI